MRSDEWQVTSDKKEMAMPKSLSLSDRPASRSIIAFTLIELLVVISIMALIAALAVPALKNLGKSNVQAGAVRQILDDVGRARQLAISGHTTVYMIFVRTNFWTLSSGAFAGSWWNSPNGLTAAQQMVASNLCEKQLMGYTFVSLRSVGDQPGQGKTRYLAPWQSLPEGMFIAQQKFQIASNYYYNVYGNSTVYQVYGFCLANNIPFPTEDSPLSYTKNPVFSVPYIAFNYLGQLTFDGQTMAWRDEFIPLAQGTVSPAIDVNTKAPVIPVNQSGYAYAPSVNETPPGNSTNSMFNLIHIDRFTGRATLESQKVQ